jgi:membrane protein implicated in regulation of membrane protease activity
MWMFFLLALIIGAIIQNILAPQISMSIMFVSFIFIGVAVPVLWMMRAGAKNRQQKGLGGRQHGRNESDKPKR